jgi:hypothetical protein
MGSIMGISQKSLGRKASLLTIAAGFAAGALQTGQADAALLLDYNGNATVIADGGAGDLDGIVNGQIINQSLIAGFGVTINIATSNSPGDAFGANLQISTLSVENLAPGPAPATLTIRLTDTDFSAPGGAGSPMLLTSSIGGTFLNAALGDSVIFQSFADPTEAVPAAAITSGPQLHVKTTGLNPESFNSTVLAPWIRGAGDFSLTNVTTITLSPGATFEQLNGSGTTSVTPEPAALSLVALAGLMLTGRRRTRA